MNEAVDAHTGRPRTEGARGGGDLAMRPLTTDELRDQGMVRAEQLSGQLCHPQLNLAQVLLMVVCQGCARGTPGEVRLDRFQTLLDQVKAARHLDER